MTFTLTKIWIVLSALLVCTGWILSALGQLNRAGYAVVIGLAVLVTLPFVRRMWKERPILRLTPLRRRLRRPLSLAFFFFVALTFIGGLLYAPNNYDALAYRVPRTLHWLAEGQWHWIHTNFYRMNTRAEGCEWTMAPLLLFAGTERILWLPNFFMFAAMPGLLFTLFRGCGAARRVAWQWMWILPCGYCFLLQAGGISTDLPGAFFGVAAVALALRSRKSGRIADLWCSGLAAALATSVKASNLPLGLPWLIAAWPSLRLFATRPIATTGIALAGLLTSFLPGALLNQKYCGDWSGAKLELPALNGAPVWLMVAGNAAGLTVQNLTPPVFPIANQWNSRVHSWLPDGVREKVNRHFEGGGGMIEIYEMQIEENTGIGFGVAILLIAAVGTSIAARRETPSGTRVSHALRWACALAPLAYMAKVGISSIARVFAPYYPFVVAVIIVARGQQSLSRRKWWHALTALQFACALLLFVITPARPLWPALTVLEKLVDRPAPSPIVLRMLEVYSVQRVRPDVMAPVRDALPPGAHNVGLVTGDDLETSFWRPFFSRTFLHVIATDPPESLSARGIEWIVISDDAFRIQTSEPLATWLAARNADLVRTIPVAARGVRGAVPWHIVHVRPPTLTP